MQIKHNLQPGIPRPHNRVVQEWQLALDIRVSLQRIQRPVPDGYAHMIESIRRDLLEIRLGDPRVPVVRQPRGCLGLAQRLSVGIFIDDGVIFGPFGEDRGRDPWFENEPASEVDAADYVVLVVKGEVAVLSGY